MKPNLSARDRKVRIAAAAGLSIIALLGSYSMTFVWILYGTALLLVVTAAASRCPVYHVGSKLRSAKQDSARGA
jgi:hypothetical protein